MLNVQKFGFSLGMRILSLSLYRLLVCMNFQIIKVQECEYVWSEPESSQGSWNYQPRWLREASGLRFVDLSECRSLTAPTVVGTAQFPQRGRWTRRVAEVFGWSGVATDPNLHLFFSIQYFYVFNVFLIGLHLNLVVNLMFTFGVLYPT